MMNTITKSNKEEIEKAIFLRQLHEFRQIGKSII